jgi:hypothetical protein
MWSMLPTFQRYMLPLLRSWRWNWILPPYRLQTRPHPCGVTTQEKYQHQQLTTAKAWNQILDSHRCCRIVWYTVANKYAVPIFDVENSSTLDMGAYVGPKSIRRTRRRHTSGDKKFSYNRTHQSFARSTCVDNKTECSQYVLLFILYACRAYLHKLWENTVRGWNLSVRRKIPFSFSPVKEC